LYAGSASVTYLHKFTLSSAIPALGETHQIASLDLFFVWTVEDGVDRPAYQPTFYEAC
jgi:hypothetical protein